MSRGTVPGVDGKGHPACNACAGCGSGVGGRFRNCRFDLRGVRRGNGSLRGPWTADLGCAGPFRLRGLPLPHMAMSLSISGRLYAACRVEAAIRHSARIGGRFFAPVQRSRIPVDNPHPCRFVQRVRSRRPERSIFVTAPAIPRPPARGRLNLGSASSRSARPGANRLQRCSIPRFREVS